MLYKDTCRQRNDVQDDSPKIKVAKVKIKPLCETRWVERHTSKIFMNLFFFCLDTISQNKECRYWEAKAKTEAQKLFHQIIKPAFISDDFDDFEFKLYCLEDFILFSEKLQT